MGTDTTTELEDFRHFVDEKLTNDGTNLSPEECLALWRAQHPSPDELADSVGAVQAALADMKDGDTGRPVDEVVQQIRKDHKLSQGS